MLNQARRRPVLVCPAAQLLRHEHASPGSRPPGVRYEALATEGYASVRDAKGGKVEPCIEQARPHLLRGGRARRRALPGSVMVSRDRKRIALVRQS